MERITLNDDSAMTPASAVRSTSKTTRCFRTPGENGGNAVGLLRNLAHAAAWRRRRMHYR
jgi:hypothetical protein